MIRIARCLSLTLVLALASCAERGSPPEASDAAIVGTPESLETVNELISQGSSFTDNVVDRLFVQLVDELPTSDAESPSYAPRLATSWQFSEDRSTLTFELRDDARWSDGEPITAEDVRFTWQAQVSPEVGWIYSEIKADISDVEVVSPHTVRFHYTQPSSHQLIDANEGVILPRHAWSELPFDQWRQQPDWFVDNLVTSGPFQLESWQRRQRIVLGANPLYMEPGLPKLQRVVFETVMEPANRLARLTTGDLDFIYSLRPAQAQALDAEPEIEVLRYPDRQFNLIVWNTERPYFRDPAVRRALALGTDRQAVVETLFSGEAVVGSSPLVHWVWAHPQDLEPWPYDPERARELLTEAGWIDSDGDGVRERDGVPFAFELTSNTGNDTRVDAMEMLEQQLAQIGVDVTIRTVEYDTLNSMNLRHDFDATIVGFLMDTTLDLSYSFHSREIENGYNFGSYRNPEVDRLIDEANSKLDTLDMGEPLAEVQRILHREQPMLFLWEPLGLVAVRRPLTGVEPNAISPFFNMRHWTKRGD